MDVALIESLAANNDLTALADAAHKLKGSAGTLYAHGLYRATSELERTARSGKGDSVASLVDNLKREASLCVKEIPAIIAHLDKEIPAAALS